MITFEQLWWMCEPLPWGSRLEEVYPYLGPTMDEFEIVGPDREAMFLAQVAHESDRFRALEEYASGQRYEGRRDLGNIRLGDGRRFKGRGLIQLTGRDNYAAYSAFAYGDPNYLLEYPEVVALLPDAARAAGWFWGSRNLNDLADVGDFRQVTRRINGGLNGWEDRLRLYQRASEIFAASANPTDTPY